MLRTIPLLLALAVVAPATALAQSALVSRESNLPVKETADRLAKALEEKGIKVAARFNHAAGAKGAGLDMPPTEVLVFGNPKLGTPLMLANPEIAIDLPMRMVVWQGKDGKTRVGYAAPEALKAKYAIKDKDELFKTMTGALESFAKAAAGSK